MVYVNGDSYACFSDGKTYADFLGEYLGTHSVNAAISGSCNARILRTTVRDLIKINSEKVYVVISLSFPLRTELWDDQLIGKNRFINDGEFTSFALTTSKRWYYDKEKVSNGRYKNWIEQQLRWYNVEAETVNLLKDVLLLTAWLKSKKILYVILSGPLQEPIDFQSAFVKDFYSELRLDPNIIDFFENSFTEWCISRGHKPIDNYTQEIHGKTYTVGHHGETAHRDFAEFVVDNYFRS